MLPMCVLWRVYEKNVLSRCCCCQGGEKIDEWDVSDEVAARKSCSSDVDEKVCVKFEILTSSAAQL